MNLSELAELYAAEGPFVSIYLDTPSDVVKAGDRLALRWKNVLRDLEVMGVDEVTRDALTAALGNHAEGRTRVLIATPSSGQVRLALSLPDPPAQEVVSLAPLPKLVPLVGHLATRIPYLVVRADRTGADIEAYREQAQPVGTSTVTGETGEIHKAHAGGRAQRRVYDRVENAWEANAGQIVAAVDRAAAEVGARVVVALGDSRELGLIAQHLPARLAHLLETVPGARGAEPAQSTEHRIAEAVADRATKDMIDLLGSFAEERGQRDRACDGAAQTIDALRRAQVEVLLLTEEVETDAPVWFGPAAADLGLAAGDVPGQPRQAPLVDVVLRAALGTGATVRRVPAGMAESPREGLGALLRYAAA